jgi:membrane protein DedA with SNARE-associated domain
MKQVFRLLYGFPLLGAGLIFFLEGFGTPIPVEIPLGIIGFRLARGLNTYWEMVWLMFGSSLAGNIVGYAIGYYGGRPLALKLTRKFGVNDELWEKIEAWFRRWGLLLVIGTRWINWGFAQNMMLCGITRVPFRTFLFVLVVNDFLWAMAWVWVAHAAVVQLRRIQILHDYPTQIGWGAVIVIAISVSIWLIWKRFRRVSV